MGRLGVGVAAGGPPGKIAAGMEARNQMAKGGRATTLIHRHRFAEDELARMVMEGVRQYVVLGAGLDTFAYRQPPFAEALEIIEVDHPATQAWKRASLAAAGIPLPSNLNWAPVDFQCDTLSDRLSSAGFDRSQPACFSWLGVTQYLTLPAIDDTLRFVAGLPSPSTLVLTFVVPMSMIPPEQHEAMNQVLQTVAAAGEPFLTFFDPAELRARDYTNFLSSRPPLTDRGQYTLLRGPTRWPASDGGGACNDGYGLNVAERKRDASELILQGNSQLRNGLTFTGPSSLVQQATNIRLTNRQ